MAGGGMNASSYKASNSGFVVGGGLNLKTDLGYYFNDQWAFDWGIAVKFNRIDGISVWDTLMTIGPRYQFKNSPYFIRLFGGQAPTVIYSEGKGFLNSKDDDASRIQFDGPVFGLAGGKIYKTKKEMIWFVEVAILHQMLTDRTGIENNGDIPVETFQGKTNNPIEVISVLGTIGMRIF